MKMSPILLCLTIFIRIVNAWIFDTIPQPRICKVSSWSSWTKCSGECTRGISFRSRRVLSRDHIFSRCQKPGLISMIKCLPSGCGISCEWSEWGHWTACDPCRSGLMSRSRKISRPAMLNGRICVGSEYTVAPCIPTLSCYNPIPSCEDAGMFACVTGDECVDHYLLCNGDSDCRDRSDERDCKPDMTTDVCVGKQYSDLPNGYLFGSGYDILKNSASGQVLDNTKFQGICDTIYVPELNKSFRKPYNLQMYRSFATAQTTLHSYIYKDTLSMTNSKLLEFEFKIESRPTLPVPMVSGANAAKANDELWKSIVDSNSKDDYSYVNIVSTIEVGQFKLRRGHLKVSHHFKERIKGLPRMYDAAVYSHFISDFGTHYYTEGKVGGLYQIIHRVQSKKLGMTNGGDQTLKTCLLAKYYNMIVGKNISRDSVTPCYVAGGNNLLIDTVSHAVTDSMSVVSGGYSAAAAELTYAGHKAIKSIYSNWAKTVPRSPIVFDFKIAPISELVDDFDIRMNLDIALHDLYAKFDPSNCQSVAKCMNGGKFVVVSNGRECKCVCNSPYFGRMCEKSARIL